MLDLFPRRKSPSPSPAKIRANIFELIGGVRYASIFIPLTDAARTAGTKTKLSATSPEAVKESNLAGEAIIAKLTRAPGNNAAIGGLKVVTATGWFAARPSGTENIYKIYAESFRDEAHLKTIVSEAQQIVNNALAGSGKT